MFLLNAGMQIGLIFCIWVFPTEFLLSQGISTEEKRTLMDEQVRAIQQATDSVVSGQYNYLNGKMHRPVSHKTHHPYLGSNEWQKGELNYSGNTFNVRTLKYDIQTDHLILLPYNLRNSFPIALSRNYIQTFNMAGRTFTYFPEIDLRFGSIPMGYLEVIHNGDTKFFLKWQKEEAVNNTLGKLEYRQQIFMLLWKDGRFYRVRNRWGLINRLSDRRQEIRKFMRENDLRFNKNNYMSAKKILEYYDKL